MSVYLNLAGLGSAGLHLDCMQNFLKIKQIFQIQYLPFFTAIKDISNNILLGHFGPISNFPNLFKKLFLAKLIFPESVNQLHFYNTFDHNHNCNHEKN